MPSKPAILTLGELSDRLTSPHAHGDVSALGDSALLSVKLCAADRLSAAELGELARQVGRLPCPVIAVAEDPHPLAVVFDACVGGEQEAQRIARNIAHAPLAAMVLVQVLRATEAMPVAQALLVESLAYATLQAGPEFRRWSAAHPPVSVACTDLDPPVAVERDGDHLSIRLNRPGRRNAIGVEMRDALTEALQLVLADPSIRSVTVSGNGACFSIGGDVDEFGTAPDPASAHAIRSLRLPAVFLAQCADRVEFRLHSACIGAGMEIPAFGKRVIAASSTFFQLPELRFGLIPGAGGCVSVPRRIGRQRTAYLALSMQRINASTALAWGLVDAIED